MTDLHSSGRNRSGVPGAPLLVSAVMLLLVVGVLPWSDHLILAAPGFLPAWLATLVSCDVLTALLLLGRSRSGANPRLVVMAAGFLGSAVTLIGTSLALPDVVTHHPVITDGDVLWWLWLARHVLPPLGVALALLPWPATWRYGVTEESRDAEVGVAADPTGGPSPVDLGSEAEERRRHGRLVRRIVVPVLVLTFGLLGLGLLTPSWFPAVSRASNAMGVGSEPFGSALVAVVAVDIAAVVAAVAGIIVRRGRSRLEAWAVVAAVAVLGDVLLTAPAEPAFTAGYYACRGLGLAAGLTVLCFMLSDVLAMHQRTAQDAARLLGQNRELLEAGRLRDHLVTVVSHEMRTPLAGLQGYLELMSAEPDDDPMTSARVLERSWLLTRRLTLLAEDLLAVATVEQGEFVVIPETVHLAHQIDECVACFPGLDLRVECPSDLMVHADTLRLQQILSNLVRNAREHGAEPITLTCATVPHPSRGQVSIRVADSGAGVPRDFVHRLFERYSRGVDRSPGGSGLGLSVVRDLVRAHGGSVRYDLTHPAFVVTLPQPAPAPAPRRPSGRPLQTVGAPSGDLVLAGGSPEAGAPAGRPGSALEAFALSATTPPDPSS